MKKLKSLPFLLLLSFLSYTQYKTPTLQDALIILSLSVLYGYDLYLEHKLETIPKQDEKIEELKKQLAEKELEMRINEIENHATQKQKLSSLTGKRVQF